MSFIVSCIIAVCIKTTRVAFLTIQRMHFNLVESRSHLIQTGKVSVKIFFFNNFSREKWFFCITSNANFFCTRLPFCSFSSRHASFYPARSTTPFLFLFSFANSVSEKKEPKVSFSPSPPVGVQLISTDFSWVVERGIRRTRRRCFHLLEVLAVLQLLRVLVGALHSKIMFCAVGNIDET